MAGQRKIRITCLHGYSGRNLGDASIIEGTQHVFEKEFGPCEWLSASLESNKDYRYHKNNEYFRNLGFSILPAFFPSPQLQKKQGNPPGKPLQVVRFLRGFLYYSWCRLACRILGSNARYLVGPACRDFIKAVSNADVVISRGCGCIHGRGLRGWLYLRRVLSYYNIVKALNEKVVVYGQSIGPVSGKALNKLVKKTFSRIDLIGVREDCSAQFLKSLEIVESVTLIPDLAFALAPPDAPQPPPAAPLRIAITARNWTFPGMKNPDRLKQTLEIHLAKTLDSLIQARKAEIHFLPHSLTDNEKEDDRKYFDKILVHMEHADAVHVHDQPDTIEELMHLYSTMHCTVGMRLHSLILSANMRVPCVGIVCEKPKMLGTLKLLSLEEMAVNVEDLTTENLLEKIELALGEKERIREIQDRRVREFRIALEKSVETISRIFEV